MPLVTEAEIAASIRDYPARTARRWTGPEDDHLRAHWGRAPMSYLTAYFERTEKAVRLRAFHLLGTTLDRMAMPTATRKPTRTGPKT